MLYVIQTKTGQEEELILFFERMVSADLYRSCFVPKGEWMKRLGGEWLLQTTPLFPGYVFVETERPDDLFLDLKAVPRLTKILGDGSYFFTPLREAEERFLRLIMGDRGDSIVRLSVADVGDDGVVRIEEGTLKFFEQDIVKINLRKRFALINVHMLGEEKTVIFGIRLRKDEE